jgi:hypothetical protein
MTGDIILLLVCIGMGILIGRNWHGETDREYKKRLLRELDSELKDELAIAKNLNESLQQDITDLKRKLRKIQINKNL